MDFATGTQAGMVSGMVGKYQISTLGCKVNQYESQRLREVLESLGMREAGPGDQPSLAVVNTCAVTVGASSKNRKLIRRLARGGQTSVVVVGCGASADGEQLRRLDGVTAVLGHNVDAPAELRRIAQQQVMGDRAAIPAHELRVVSDDRARPLALGDDVWMRPRSTNSDYRIEGSKDRRMSLQIVADAGPAVKTASTAAEPLLDRIDGFAGHHRAFLKIQDGCDAHCTYCIIPQLRPNLRSKPVEAAVEEARALVRAGHREIILTGIFLGAFGRKTALRKRFTPGSTPLAGLVAALAKVDGLERLRLSSLEPGDVDDALLAVLASNRNCVPHLHLPLQSGSESILRRMNRQYARDDFLGMVDRVRAALDQPAITTDIIAGFPGETDGDFEATLDVARYCRFCKIHAFPFSPRPNTAAARWQKNFVPSSVTRERMDQLAAVERECSLTYRLSLVGRTERVIVEERVVRPVKPFVRGEHAARSSAGMSENGSGAAFLLRGRCDRYFEIHFGSTRAEPGDLIDVRIDRVTPTRTHGTPNSHIHTRPA
jgi:threonylcarbamoyladenosine tRNA methylthiotransferase MtaB